jgi:hypothetical protein
LDRRIALLIAPLLVLPGCEMTVEVEGMLGGSEVLSGSMTLYDDGGTIELFGSPKTHCVGNFGYRRQGRETKGLGTLVCDDRRMGPFGFSLKGTRHGEGTGTLNGTPYRFRF